MRNVCFLLIGDRWPNFSLWSFDFFLQCDGQYIPLPSLQGIAVLNIPSYAGGTNFWGGTKEDDVSHCDVE